MSDKPRPPLTEADLQQLFELLASLPAPLAPMDPSALDGYLCGVLLQPRPVPAAQWLPFVCDLEGRALPKPAADAAARIAELAQRRHAELDRAIAARDWFDPWIFPEAAEPGVADTAADDATDDDAGGGEAAAAVQPWVAGFAAAMERFPAMFESDDPELVEPLALLFQHFDAEALEDAEALLAFIEGIEPPADLAEAVQDLVRAVMLIADVTRPRTAAPKPARPGARGTRPATSRKPPPRRR